MYRKTWSWPQITPNERGYHRTLQEVEDWQTQLEHQLEVYSEDAEQKAHDCKEVIKIYPKIDTYCYKFHEMMIDFGSLWDGHVGCIRVAKHSIEQTSNTTRPFHCALYSREPWARGFEKTEIDTMMKLKLFEPAEMWQATLIVFTSKKDGPLSFLWTMTC